MSNLPIQQILEQEAGSIPDLIRRHARERPDHPALVQDERRLGFAELDALMDRVDAGLQRDGLPVGGAIAIAAYTSIEYAAVFLGALRAGVVVTPLQPGATPDSLAAMLADAGAAFLFLDAPMGEAL